MASPYPVEGLASWKPALGLQGKRLCAVLANLAFRQGVRDELAAPSALRLFNGEWDKVHVVEVAQPRHRELEQRSVRDIAQRLGKDPLDAMLDLALDEDLATIFTAQLLNSDEAAVARLLNHPHSLISLSDAGAHLTFFNDAGFGLHLLGHWVRERGAMRLQDAVRRLTHQSAEIFGLPGRGLAARGLCGGSAVVRSGDGGPRPQPPRVRPARWRTTAAHRCGGRARRSGSTASKWPAATACARERAVGRPADRRVRALNPNQRVNAPVPGWPVPPEGAAAAPR